MDNLDWAKEVPDDEIKKHLESASLLPTNTSGLYLKGPIPISWIGTASKLRNPRADTVALLCWLAASLERPLSKMLQAEFGVSRWTVARNLKLLEAEDLISVTRQKGCAPRVSIIAPS